VLNNALALAGRGERAWLDGQLSAIPPAWRGRDERQHEARVSKARAIPSGRGWQASALAEATRWLVDTVAKVGEVRVPVDMSDGDLCDLAERQARECMDLAGGAWLRTAELIRDRLARHVEGYGIRPPGSGIEHGPAISRMTCAQWWRRGLRRVQARAIEGAAVRLGYVHRDAEIYASTATVERRGQQRARNAATLADTLAVNLDTGQEFNLAELAARSVANPRIRRGELMTRIAGFEAVARSLDHVAEFWTATCPSRMHARRQDGRRTVENPKYDGTTPREAQQYLGRCWARFRSAIARRGLAIYGFRIAEPHHDATPHWHLLVFSPALLSAGRAAVGRLRALFRRYFLADSASERGARANRCEFKAIDWLRGSAAGYVAKYVAKNVEGGGYEVQGDIEGADAIYPAARVEAWASTWGIRQFQQVGGPPVGVWRELRRFPDGAEVSPLVAAARAAADCGTLRGHDESGAAGNWRRYVEVMGGPVLGRAYRPLKLAKTEKGERFDAATGEILRGVVSRYGELAEKAVWGVHDVLAGEKFASVRYRWELRRGGGVGVAVGPEFPASRSPVNNCTRPAVLEVEEGVSDGGARVEGTGGSVDGYGSGGAERAGGAVSAGRRAPGDRGYGQAGRGHGASH
jgi:hypothetical protein